MRVYLVPRTNSPYQNIFVDFFRIFCFVLGQKRQAWEGTTFTTMNHREQPGVFILGSLEEILMVLEDNQVRRRATH